MPQKYLNPDQSTLKECELTLEQVQPLFTDNTPTLSKDDQNSFLTPSYFSEIKLDSKSRLTRNQEGGYFGTVDTEQIKDNSNFNPVAKAYEGSSPRKSNF